jgi:deoxyinosine 3'endonuclease (endonuclease V)
MKATALHPWQVSPHEAIAIQKRLRAQVITENTLSEVHYIAGADISTSKDSPKAYAGVGQALAIEDEHVGFNSQPFKRLHQQGSFPKR